MKNDQAETRSEERFLDQTLRPRSFDEYVGQGKIKENLKILIKAAKERGHSPDHLLFYGPPGLGKTTLAHLISLETESSMKSTSGPAIEKVGDIASIVSNLSPGDILFIDEIHRLNKAIEEVLYPAMESGVLNIILGKGPSARTIQLDLPPFTLIEATTRIAMLSSPLRSRFSGGIFQMDFYNDNDIKKILARSAKILSIEVTTEALEEISCRSRATPRTANYLLKRCRDLAQLSKQKIDSEIANKTFELLGIDRVGLNDSDRRLLRTLSEKFGGGPVGLNTLAASLSEDEATIEEYNEPYLLQKGFIERTPRGRLITQAGLRHVHGGLFGN